jgi:23S rRNA (uridine2552-2'-O)-methyltransferase
MPKPYTPNDALARKAKEEGYRARSVYKLQELDQKFKLLKPGMSVLDLGAAPGSWLQYASQKVGPKGRVVGIDLQEIEPIDGVNTYQADITDSEAIARILSNEANEAFEADIIISDLAPSTSGVRDVDQWRSIELSQAVMNFTEPYLKPKGRVVMKMLRGGDFDEFIKDLKSNFDSVKIAQVKASRDRSREVYVIVNCSL